LAFCVVATCVGRNIAHLSWRPAPCDAHKLLYSEIALRASCTHCACWVTFLYHTFSCGLCAQQLATVHALHVPRATCSGTLLKVKFSRCISKAIVFNGRALSGGPGGGFGVPAGCALNTLKICFSFDKLCLFVCCPKSTLFLVCLRAMFRSLLVHFDLGQDMLAQEAILLERF
jgi:hypothetical protein